MRPRRYYPRQLRNVLGMGLIGLPLFVGFMVVKGAENETPKDATLPPWIVEAGKQWMLCSLKESYDALFAKGAASVEDAVVAGMSECGDEQASFRDAVVAHGKTDKRVVGKEDWLVERQGARVVSATLRYLEKERQKRKDLAERDRSSR